LAQADLTFYVIFTRLFLVNMLQLYSYFIYCMNYLPSGVENKTYIRHLIFFGYVVTWLWYL